MGHLGKFLLLEQVARRARQVRARTWLLLAAVALGLVGLLIWAAVAVLSWLWTQAPAVTDVGRRVADEAMTRIEQVAPGLKEEIDRRLPGTGAAPPARDVSGADIGPVPRFAGLVRTYFARGGGTVEARYAGRASFEAVLAHYVKGFTAAGYAQEVLSATPQTEQHRFRRGRESIDLTLTRRPDGLLELRVKQQDEG